MKKNKSITLLAIIGVLIAALAVMTFIRFPIGIKNYNSILGTVSLDYDMVGGTSYTLEWSNDNDEDIEDVNAVLNTLGSRMNALGYTNYSVTSLRRTGEGINVDEVHYDFRISALTTASLSSDISVVASYGTVKFYGGSSENPTTEIMTEEKAVSGSAYVGTSVNENGSTVYLTSIVFSDYGYKELKTLISENDTAYLKIALGDSDNVLFNGKISDSGISNKTVYMQLTSETAAKQTALQISTGGLAYKFDISDPAEITPILGENTVAVSIITVSVLLALAAVLFFVFYKGFGITSLLTLFTFILVEVAMLVAIPGITVSIGGIVGIILSSILTAEGLAVTFKRIKDEFAKGKTVKAAVKTGFNGALNISINVCVIFEVAALLLFAFTTGAIKSFAITLAIGVVVSFACTVLLARALTWLILPLIGNDEKFLGLTREDK